jgi:hypothetical protein
MFQVAERDWLRGQPELKEAKSTFDRRSPRRNAAFWLN